MFFILSFRAIAGEIAIALILSVLPAWGQKWVTPSTPQVGSENTVTADPTVPRPTTQPCVVQLFTNFDFDNYHPKTFSYSPPSNCPGPWAKVVLNADWSVDAGSQYDRTAEIWIGAVNLYFGTTSEPSKNVARSWHTENDVTEYSPLFTTPQSGRVDLGNGLDKDDPSHLHGTSYLEFYPLVNRQPPPVVADVILAMAEDSDGGTATLNTGTDALSKTFNLPTNIEKAYLDVYAQGQNLDEWWYTCVPTDLFSEFGSCINTAFRESEVTIDGQPAGFAPVYPWIFTGGIDHYLWRPIPAVQTLNFEPYRIDLTPFAAILSNGAPHTLALSVDNAENYFSATATLVLYLDHGSRQVTGALLKNTIGQPNPKVWTNIQTDGTAYYGPVSVVSNRGTLLSGYVNTSHGRVQTDVAQSVVFSNLQNYYATTDFAVYNDVLKQFTTIAAQTTTKSVQGIRVDAQLISWPFTMNSAENQNTGVNVTTIAQGVSETRLSILNGWPIYFSTMEVELKASDTLLWKKEGWTPQNPTTSERFTYMDSTGACWDRSISASNFTLTSYTDRCKKK